MYKGQAFFIVTVFVVLFMLMLKNMVYTTPRYNLYSVDQLKVDNLLNELSNFIPRYFGEENLIDKLKTFENYVHSDDLSVNFISFVLNYTDYKIYYDFIKTADEPIHVTMMINGNEVMSKTLSSDFSGYFNVSNTNSTIYLSIQYNDVVYPETFVLQNSDISHFIIVSKKIGDQEIIIEHKNKVYAGIIST